MFGRLAMGFANVRVVLEYQCWCWCRLSLAHPQLLGYRMDDFVSGLVANAHMGVKEPSWGPQLNLKLRVARNTSGVGWFSRQKHGVCAAQIFQWETRTSSSCSFLRPENASACRKPILAWAQELPCDTNSSACWSLADVKAFTDSARQVNPKLRFMPVRLPKILVLMIGDCDAGRERNGFANSSHRGAVPRGEYSSTGPNMSESHSETPEHERVP